MTIMTDHFNGSVLEHRGVRSLVGSSPTNKMASTERKEALWGERAHLPVSAGVPVRIITNGNILCRGEALRAALPRKVVKRLFFRKAEAIGAELCGSSQGVSGLVPLVGQSE